MALVLHLQRHLPNVRQAPNDPSDWHTRPGLLLSSVIIPGPRHRHPSCRLVGPPPSHRVNLFSFSSPPSAITTVLHPLHDTVHDGHLLFLALSFSIDHLPWAVTATFYLFGCLSVSCFSPVLSVGGGFYNGLGGNNNICRLNLWLSTQHNTCGSLYYSPRVANIVRLHSTASFCYLDPD